MICGFISGKNELLNWETSDLFQFYYDTTPIKGSLDCLLEKIDKQTVKRATIVFINSRRIERAIFDTRDAVGNGNACKFTAILERKTFDTRDAVGNDNACKSATTFECRLSNACYRFPLMIIGN